MKEITVHATVENISKVTAFVDEQLEKLACPMKAQMQLDVAIDELLGNIAHYAYAPGTGDATVRFDFDEAARVVSVTFLDSGVPFDPLVREDPNVHASAAERGVGGLGIYLVKKTMDRVDYRYADGKNILTIQKCI
ncbi:MAG: ATP-binding protein [Clostridia bacterium]|nr:ATP-binding protein [Clostridia bacterium]